jgi:hypothetical protein
MANASLATFGILCTPVTPAPHLTIGIACRLGTNTTVDKDFFCLVNVSRDVTIGFPPSCSATRLVQITFNVATRSKLR